MQGSGGPRGFAAGSPQLRTLSYPEADDFKAGIKHVNDNKPLLLPSQPKGHSEIRVTHDRYVLLRKSWTLQLRSQDIHATSGEDPKCCKAVYEARASKGRCSDRRGNERRRCPQERRTRKTGRKRDRLKEIETQ